MTPQEAFDKAILHLLTQGKRAFRGGNCYYRLTDTSGKVLMCAVGCLIPDEMYQHEMENVSAVGLLEKFPALHDVLPNMDMTVGVNILTDLQRLHDRSTSWTDAGPALSFFADARKIAQDHRLHTDVLDQWEARAKA